MASPNFKYYQPNKLDIKDKYGDCVVRALTKVTGKEWLEIFEELLPYARKLQCMPSGKPCYERYLAEHNFVYHGISNKKGTKRPTVAGFAKTHKEGIYFLNVANHCVAVAGGNYYDTWDSGDCCLYGYWEKKLLKISGIDWETDGDLEALETLPKEVVLPIELSKGDYEEIDEYLAKTYGFFHNGYVIEQ